MAKKPSVHWEDLTDKEKIEKLQSVADTNWKRIAALEEQVVRLFYHSHQEGQIMVPPRQGTGPLNLPPYPVDPWNKKP